MVFSSALRAIGVAGKPPPLPVLDSVWRDSWAKIEGRRERSQKGYEWDVRRGSCHGTTGWGTFLLEEELLPSFLLRAFTQGVPQQATRTSSGPCGLFQDQRAACRAAPARAQLPSAALADATRALISGVVRETWSSRAQLGSDIVAAVVPPLPSLASTATSTDDEKASGPVKEELLPSFLLRAFTQGVPTSSGPGGLFQDQGAACRAAPARAQLPSAGLGRRYRGAHLRGRSWDVVLASSAGIRHRCAVPWQAPHTVEQLCAGDDPVAAVVPPLPSLASTATSTDDEKAVGTCL
ncbi:hypothetical protein HPB48_000428 [Haemaphysalis longicornis]|uniref:Uncharacterized protein n=1 Tax=Haemaphysalis longicornis TaxID=44386 RepID=A0A9J6G9H0_HAELO|nr:hypothetical protein HPB48_000428 [Haemaphysalis longicornis]